jgi:hypothetical protein
MREYGSLLTEPGYDEKTQLWFKSSGDVVLPDDLPQRPTKGDAQKALELLKELIAGFAFDGEVARAAAVAAIMTVVLRAILKAVPLFLITATEARTGKTFLVELISVIATGHKPIPTAGGTTKEEMEKRIETAALAGRAIMNLNNLENGMVVKSEALAQICSEGLVHIRKLGKHEEGVCDCRATTPFLNGNNISVAADLVPRTVLCQLDAKREDPEKRTFGFDPIDRVRKNRGAYIGAVFTIVRAYMAEECPQQEVHRVAGFESWSQRVQQPLVWLGMEDPLGGMKTMRALDETIEELQKLHAVLRKYFNAGTEFTVADCQEKADEHVMTGSGRSEYKRPDLRDLMTVRGRIDGNAFGSLLRKHRGRINDGWYLRIEDKKVNKSNVYTLQQTRPDAPLPPVTEPDADREARPDADVPPAADREARPDMDDEIPF